MNPLFKLHGSLVASFALVGASLGIAIGVYEAAVLYTTPFPAALLEPDVRYVIWFLAPLVDSVFLGILGCALGLMAAGRKNSDWKWVAFCAALGLGVIGPAILFIECIRRNADPEFVLSVPLLIPFSWFVVLCCVLLACHVGKDRVQPILEGRSGRPFRPLALAIIVCLGSFIVGLVYFVFEPMRSRRASTASPQQLDSRPNVVLITLDTVRADHLSLYGYHRRTTPRLEEWARQGVVFEQAIAPSSWTLPAHASILTGLLPHQHGADWAVPLPAQPRTLAEIMEAEGYETATFTSNFRYGQKGWGYAQGFGSYEDDSLSLRHNLSSTVLGRVFLDPFYKATIRHEAFERRNARQLNRDIFRWHHRRSGRPYFLFVNYFDAHERYLAPPPFDAKFGKTRASLIKKVDPALAVGKASWLTEEEKQGLTIAYDNCLAYLDEQLDEFLRFLAASREWSETLVIITSDHGEAFGEHGFLGHSWNLHRETLRVPLVILGQDIPMGLRITRAVPTRALFSTVLDLASSRTGPLREESLRRFWTSGPDPQPPGDLAISELISKPGDPQMPACISAATTEWHYLHCASGKVELYDWINDPTESVNLAESSGHQEVLEQLEDRLCNGVGLSLRPWRGPSYLVALDRPGYSFLRETAFGLALDARSIHPARRIGAAQAFFAPDTARPSRRPLIPDEELLRTLPYR